MPRTIAVSLYESKSALTPEEMLTFARYALNCAERTLEGGYPWMLAKGKWTQREARETCLSVVKATLARIGPAPSSNVVYREVSK